MNILDRFHCTNPVQSIMGKLATGAKCVFEQFEVLSAVHFLYYSHKCTSHVHLTSIELEHYIAICNFSMTLYYRSGVD